MKYPVILLVCIGYIQLTSAAQPTYTNKYDKIDLDAIIRNDRLLQSYVNCLLDKGKCQADGLELKQILPDALKTGCSKCTSAQKQGSRKMILHLIKNKREWWNELEAKYDPKKEYVRKYSKELEKEGIKL